MTSHPLRSKGPALSSPCTPAKLSVALKRVANLLCSVPASPEAWRLSELSRWEAPETHRCLVAAGSDSGEVHVAAMEAGEDAKLVHAGTFVVAEVRVPAVLALWAVRPA